MRRSQATTRSLLLRAAADLLIELGKPVSIEQIRKRAGLSNGSFYHCFEDAGAMWAALRAESLAARHARVATALTTTGRAAADAVGAMVEAYLRWGSEEPQSARALFLVLPAAIGEAGAMAGQAGHSRQELAMLETWAAPLMAGGLIRDLPAVTLHLLIFGLPDLMVRSWLDGSSKDDPLSFAPALGQAAWVAIKAEAAPRPRARAGTQDVPRQKDQSALPL